jgi:hypothetical protein
MSESVWPLWSWVSSQHALQMLKNLQAGTQRVVWAMGVGSTGSA